MRREINAPEWLQVQFQERGSYRTEDVVEFLEWALPDATTPQEAMIVLLDWFAPHISEEVAGLIRRKGHVLLLHGGGVTGFEQVNASPLHGVLCCRGMFGVVCRYV